MNGKRPSQAKPTVQEKTPKRFFERRDPLEVRKNLRHEWNKIRLRTVPFLRTLLCFDFFARVVLFAGISVLVLSQVKGMDNVKVQLS